MATRKPGQYTIGSRAVAVAILSEVVRRAMPPTMSIARTDEEIAADIADALVTAAWDVEYKPNAERLVLIVDAAISSDRSRREDEPEEPELVPVPDSATQQ